jgi:hypothetical protein
MPKIIHGVEPTNVLVQWSETRLKVRANRKADVFLCWVLDIAYMCVAIASGANHHFPTGSKAQLRSPPDRIERSALTTTQSPT